MSIFDIPYQLADLDAEIKRVSEEHAESDYKTLTNTKHLVSISLIMMTL